LGTVNISVAEVLRTDDYKRYKERKFARMDLLKKYGVADIRQLEFSVITLETYNELKDLWTPEVRTPAIIEAQ